MYEAIIFFLLLWPASFGQHLTDEAIYTVNGKKTLHTVSEKFLSISIDPAVLLTGLNLSETTLQMAKLLSPAYIRLAGPSTQFVKYQDENWNDVENGMLVVTSAMWFGINEWLASANLTPVFGINDRDIGTEGWNPQDTMGLLETSDKFNVSCYWQLGYDCSNKTKEQYKNDLRRLQHVLDAFPDKKNRWGIVGSDLSFCVHDSKRILDELADVVVAVVQENPKTIADTSIFKPKVSIWVTSPKCRHSALFSSAISWAKELGEASRIGYEVILRQPRLHEIFSETPPFWVSYFHKLLMGRHVLEIKTTLVHPELSVYAHCTKHQNDFIRPGAMTILTVNNCTTNHTILVKFGSIFMKNAEVQSYILTTEETGRDVFLNGEKLKLTKFAGDKLNIVPKLRRARIMNYLSLFLPPKSVGFFVVPGAQIPVCATEENDLREIIEEIRQDQNLQFPDEDMVFDVNLRFSPYKTQSLRELQKKMEAELESDERLIKQMKQKDNVLQKIRSRPTEVQHKLESKKIFELELTSAEIRKVLFDRAKTKAARKNIIFTSEELEEIMDKATQKFLSNKNTSIRIRKKSKRETSREKKDINMRLLKLKTLGDRRHILRQSLHDSVKDTLKKRKSKFTTPVPTREKRDINMELLKLKTEMLHNNHKNKKIKKKFEDKEERQATIREPGQTSNEFLVLEDEKEESPLPDQDVYAELADSDILFLTTTERNKLNKPKNRFNLHKTSVSPKIEVKPFLYKPEEMGVTENDFEPDFSFDDGNANQNFDCIHEFFGTTTQEVKSSPNMSELWEFGLKPVEEKTNNCLPNVKNRIHIDNVELEELKTLANSEGIEGDYDQLESDEISPLRLKRDVDNILGKEYDFLKVKIDENVKDHQFKMLKDRLVQKKKINFINKSNRYKSLSEGIKSWKSSDILNLKDMKKYKRSVDHDVDSVENEIETFLKNAELVKPKFDMENGDYQLIFPNKDKIEVVGGHGETELKLMLHKDEDLTTKTNIQKISKKKMDNVWDKLYRKLTKFFHGLSARLKKCIVEDLLK